MLLIDTPDSAEMARIEVPAKPFSKNSSVAVASTCFLTLDFCV